MGIGASTRAKRRRTILQNTEQLYCRFRRQEVGAKLVAQVKVKKFNLIKGAKGKVFPSTRLNPQRSLTIAFMVKNLNIKSSESFSVFCSKVVHIAHNQIFKVLLEASLKT